jgi:hypothetical protein
MGLLHLINTENDKNYISLFEAINLLAKKQARIFMEVATYLLNKDVHIQLYSHTRDNGYKIVQTSYILTMVVMSHGLEIMMLLNY